MSYVQSADTEFEKRRGLSSVDSRGGLARVSVSNLTEPLSESRVAVLRAVAEAGISIDFLKMTPGGLAFVIPETGAEAVRRALSRLLLNFDVSLGRVLVQAHAVNMRDEEGLIAHIVSAAIASGATLDHLADMHDRLLLVASEEDARRIESSIRESHKGPSL